jgi:hypothetical protein
MPRGLSWRTIAATSLVVVAAVPAAMFACSDPYSESSGQDAGVGAATVEASPLDAASPPDPCAHVLPPSPPAVDDAPGDELPTFYVALRTVHTLRSDKSVPGFDIDGVCTCETRPGTAYDGGGSCIRKGAPSCDVEGGVDNAMAVLATTLSPFFAFESVPNDLIGFGRRTLLIQIGRYNGRANDKDVAVGFALSDGIREADGGCPGSQPSKLGTLTPGWCGNDIWTFLPEAVIPTTKQPLVQGVGYVANGILTVQIASSLLVPFDEASEITFGSPVFAGALVPLDKNLQPRDPAVPPTNEEKRLWAVTNGTVSGRMRVGNLLTALGTISTGGGTALCQGASFALLRQNVCNGLDIASSKSLDFAPDTQCDSLSAGLEFSSFPVLPGEIHAATPSNNPCLPGPNGDVPDAAVPTPYLCP